MRLRRRAAATPTAPATAPGDDDGLALAVANRRVVLLEMTVTTLQRRLDRFAGQCVPPCPHEVALESVRFENIRLSVEKQNLVDRTRVMLARLQGLTGPGGEGA